MPLRLTDDQRKQLMSSLLGAYLSPEAFANAIWISTGVRLGDEFTLQDGKNTVLTKAVQLAEGQGWLEQLVRASMSGAPLSIPLKEFAASVDLMPLPPRPPASAAPAAFTGSALERVIRRRRPPILIQLFTERLHLISRAVCWIGWRNQCEENPQLGTGFLVAPDLLFTNHHVVDEIERGERGAVVCRFDHFSTAGGKSGPSAGLAEAWCIDKAPPAPSDDMSDGRGPAEHELDYALLRLDSEIGRAPVDPDGTGPARGWLRIGAEPPPLLKDDFVFVVQHPADTVDEEEGAQRIAVGIVTGFEGESRRVRYDTSTKPGASGSPVFTVDLQLAALHHGSQPLYDSAGKRVADAATYNRGIPLRLILKRMRTNGVPQFWENAV